MPGGNLTSELLEGVVILKTSAALATKSDQVRMNERIHAIEGLIAAGGQEEAINQSTSSLMHTG